MSAILRSSIPASCIAWASSTHRLSLGGRAVTGSTTCNSGDWRCSMLGSCESAAASPGPGSRPPVLAAISTGTANVATRSDLILCVLQRPTASPLIACPSWPLTRPALVNSGCAPGVVVPRSGILQIAAEITVAVRRETSHSPTSVHLLSRPQWQAQTPCSSGLGTFAPPGDSPSSERRETLLPASGLTRPPSGALSAASDGRETSMRWSPHTPTTSTSTRESCGSVPSRNGCPTAPRQPCGPDAERSRGSFVSAALLSIGLLLLAAVPAQAGVTPTTVKRIRTSKNTAINHIRQTPELGRGYQDEPNEVHGIECRGWRMKNGRAQVWTCSFHVVDGSKACVAKWKLGREQRIVNGTPESRQWRNTRVSGTCPHP